MESSSNYKHYLFLLVIWIKLPTDFGRAHTNIEKRFAKHSRLSNQFPQLACLFSGRLSLFIRASCEWPETLPAGPREVRGGGRGVKADWRKEEIAI